MGGAKAELKCEKRIPGHQDKTSKLRPEQLSGEERARGQVGGNPSPFTPVTSLRPHTQTKGKSRVKDKARPPRKRAWETSRHMEVSCLVREETEQAWLKKVGQAQVFPQ